MNRGKQVMVGVFLLLCMALLGWALALENMNWSDHLPTFIALMILVMLAIALLVPWGRPMVPRLAMGVGSLGLLGLAIWLLIDTNKQKEIEILAFAVVAAIIMGAYAVTGKYSREWPFAEVFADTDSSSSVPKPDQQE